MQPTSGPFIIQVLPLIFLIAIFYLILIRPQQKKQKEHQAMIEGVKKNDEVVTTGGIHGTVVNIKEKTFILRVDDAAKLEIDKASIAYIRKKRDDKTS